MRRMNTKQLFPPLLLTGAVPHSTATTRPMQRPGGSSPSRPTAEGASLGPAPGSELKMSLSGWSANSFWIRRRYSEIWLSRVRNCLAQRHRQQALGRRHRGGRLAKLIGSGEDLQALLGRLGPVQPMGMQELLPAPFAGLDQFHRGRELYDKLPRRRHRPNLRRPPGPRDSIPATSPAFAAPLPCAARSARSRHGTAAAGCASAHPPAATAARPAHRCAGHRRSSRRPAHRP